MKFNDRVLLNELKLNDTDDQIVDYIKKYKVKFVDQSIQKTAEELFTVPNTLVRFSKKLGYKGYSELKFELKNELNDLNFKSQGIDISDGLISENITKTVDLINYNTVNKVAKKINEAKRVEFLGIGDSIYFCEMFAKNLRCVGKQADFFQHRHDMLYNANNCDLRDLYIAISISGESKEIIEIAQKAKRRGATIISVTHFSENTLCKLADINLFIWAPYKCINNYNVTDRVGLMILSRIISEAFWNRYHE